MTCVRLLVKGFRHPSSRSSTTAQWRTGAARFGTPEHESSGHRQSNPIPHHRRRVTLVQGGKAVTLRDQWTFSASQWNCPADGDQNCPADGPCPPAELTHRGSSSHRLCGSKSCASPSVATHPVGPTRCDVQGGCVVGSRYDAPSTRTPAR